MKQSVCLDCYKQSLFLHQLTLSDAIREIGSIEGVTGLNATTESLLIDYPDVTDAFLEEWGALLSETGLKPVTLGSYIDRLQFRDHIMSVSETADALRRDIQIAHKLGFKNLRIMHDLPLDAVELALPLAEELDICLLDELMPPGTIKPRQGRKGMDCHNDLALIQRTGTKHFGLLINLGLFQQQPNPTQLMDVLLKNKNSITASHDYETITATFHMLEFPDFEIWMNKNFPELTKNRELFQRMFGVRLFGDSVMPPDLVLIAPYIRDIYAKFIRMYPDPGSPAEWEEPSVPYEDVVHMLSYIGYDGYLSSLRMAFPTLSLGANRSDEEIAQEEKQQVRLHQKMIRSLIS